MIIKKIDLESINLSSQEKCSAPIVGHFFDYFSTFNMEKVLLVTDEDIQTDVRVINQLVALKRLTTNIQIYQVSPNNKYSKNEKAKIRQSLFKNTIRKVFYFPWFLWLVLIHNRTLPFRTKAKQGIYNDHSYLISNKIFTGEYTCVIYNNLISASCITYHKNVDYIYDIHELEVFRNRNKSSIQRSFYIYLNELDKLKRTLNLITISRLNARTLEEMYCLGKDSIKCIYNQNFVKYSHESTDASINDYLLIYVGSVSMDRGLEDIVRLSFNYDVLIIACNYKPEAIDYLESYGNACRMMIVKGMDYYALLQDKVSQYRYPLFLILINPIHPSYRYALPNKFFQAQALGCPIIAYENTYLAEIIEEFGCGLTLLQSSVKNFEIKIDQDEYFEMKKSIIGKVGQAITNDQL